MLGWIFASIFVVFPSYGGKKHRCFELDMVEKTKLGLLPIVNQLHLWLMSNLSYMVVLECGKVVLGWWNMIICSMLPKWCGCVEISCSLENHVPHINVLAEFNQDTSEFACERCNRLQRERCAMQHIKLVGPFEMPQEWSIIYIENNEPYNKQ